MTHEATTELIRMPARGISMGKRWGSAREIIVQPVLAEDSIGWGDVVVYDQPGDVRIAHRVVRFIQRSDEVWVVTKGDGYCTPDRLPVARKNIVGIVTAIQTEDAFIDVTVVREVLFSKLYAVLGWLGQWIWRPIWSTKSSHKA